MRHVSSSHCTFLDQCVHASSIENNTPPMGAPKAACNSTPIHHSAEHLHGRQLLNGYSVWAEQLSLGSAAAAAGSGTHRQPSSGASRDELPAVRIAVQDEGRPRRGQRLDTLVPSAGCALSKARAAVIAALAAAEVAVRPSVWAHPGKRTGMERVRCAITMPFLMVAIARTCLARLSAGTAICPLLLSHCTGRSACTLVRY